MCNFQDVLLQKSQSYGPLWCNEGVYRLAKELQLLDSAHFGNIFLDLGSFHTEKVVGNTWKIPESIQFLSKTKFMVQKMLNMS